MRRNLCTHLQRQPDSGPAGSRSSEARRRLLAVLAVLVVLASACSSSDEASSDTASGSDAETSDFDFESSDESGDAGGASFDAAEQEDSEPMVDAPLGAGGVNGTEPVALQPTDLGRDIIRTAEIDVEVDNVAEASLVALTKIEGLGGLLFGQETTTVDRPRTTLVFKVQPADFTEALGRLSDVGELRDQRITADDVTERVVNLESRIITSEASVDRLRGFLADANDLATIAELERELLNRETDLELLRGQLRTLENQVSLSTITLTLIERVPGPSVVVEATAYASHDEGSTCPGDDVLQVEEGAPVTLCYVVTNAGDTHLIDIDVRDDRFDLDGADLTIVRGEIDRPLAPGDEIVFAADVDAEASATGRAQVTATPADADGAELRLASVSARDDLVLDVELDTSIPGFTEGLDAGWSAFMQVVRVIVLLAGVLLPWFWVPLGLWALVRWNRRRNAQKPASFGPPPPSAPAPEVDPQPPVDPKQPVGAGSQ